MSEIERLTARQLRAIEALLSSPTARAAAEAAQVSEATLNRWRQEPAFNAEYRRAREKAFAVTLATLQSAAAKATEILFRLVDDESLTLLDRERCAFRVVELAIKAREQFEIEERISTLEKRLMRRAA